MNSGFFATADGVKVIEFNARFGDPECMNIMSLLQRQLARGDGADLRGHAHGRRRGAARGGLAGAVSGLARLCAARRAHVRVRARPQAIEAAGCARVLLLRRAASLAGASHRRHLARGGARDDAPRARAGARAARRLRGPVAVLEWRRDVGDERLSGGPRGRAAGAARRPAGWAGRLSASCNDGAVIVERSMHPRFLSNTYLVGDGEGGPAFFIDAGGPVEPLIEAAERLGLKPTHVLLTHHHYDHVCEVGELRERWPELEVLISPPERELIEARPRAATATARGCPRWARSRPADALASARWRCVRCSPRATPPGCCPSWWASARSRRRRRRQARGDRTRQRERAPGGLRRRRARRVHRRHPVQELGGRRESAGPHHLHRPARLDHGHADGAAGRDRDLPGARRAHHGAPRVGANAFIRVWRGLDPEGAEPCHALGEPATLVLLGADYDGGTKAWVRWPDGSDDIVPGLASRARRLS